MRRAIFFAAAAAVVIGVAAAVAQTGEEPKRPISFVGLSWEVDEQVPSMSANASWAYRLVGSADVRLIEWRDTPIGKNRLMSFGEYSALPLVQRQVQARDPNTDKWVNHGPGVTFADGPVQAMFDLHEFGELVDQTSDSFSGVAIPPREGEWPKR